ncbi:ABC transporter substrate-binding protein [Rhizobium sp. BK376]|uniref:ABC transporter substrate-binding protein n=1 Tax=Rhizobium sp. BK376 TaxID=2512149 RepID=UPI0010482CEF|nr:ABC transporter substrate-binding protein [Rhizobium sp. BK376]TCR79559.1 peptide/nickel transport system substrate-binding protein [Rhizobium sp. BK376]
MRTTCTSILGIAALSLFLLPISASAQTPQKGGTLNVGVVSDPVTLDPAFFASYFELYEQYLIYEPLLTMTPDLKVVPGIASYKQIDNLTYAFDIKPGVTFQDGTLYDAVAAKFNLDRMLDPKVGSPRRSDLGPVTSVDVTGPLSFTVKFSQPYAQFPLVMTNRAGLFVSPTALQKLGPDFPAKGVGAGPYKLESWTKNGQMVLTAFDGYFKGRPALDKIVIRPIPDETLRTASLKSGDLQLTDLVPPQMLGQIKTDPNIAVADLPGLGFNAFSINNTAAPFNNKKVRQALLYAIDKDVVNKVAYFNSGTPSYGPVPPPVSWAFDANFKPYKRNIAKAKQLLAEAGHADGVSFAITVVASPLQLRIAQIIQAQAQEAGFKVSVRQVDATSLITVLQKRDYDICWSPWSGRPDPDGNMFNWFTKDGPNNFSGYQSDVVDGLMRKARVSATQDDRAAMYKQAQQIISDDAAMMFLHFDSTLQGSGKKLHWTPYPDTAFRLGDAWLEK